MKKFLIFCIAFSLAGSMQAQKISKSELGWVNDTLLYISKLPNLNPEFKTHAQDLSQTLNKYGISKRWNDTILVKLGKIEADIKAGRTQGVFDSDLVRKAQRAHPGLTLQAHMQRMKFYIRNRKK